MTRKQVIVAANNPTPFRELYQFGQASNRNVFVVSQKVDLTDQTAWWFPRHRIWDRTDVARWRDHFGGRNYRTTDSWFNAGPEFGTFELFMVYRPMRKYMTRVHPLVTNHKLILNQGAENQNVYRNLDLKHWEGRYAAKWARKVDVDFEASVRYAEQLAGTAWQNSANNWGAGSNQHRRIYGGYTKEQWQIHQGRQAWTYGACVIDGEWKDATNEFFGTGHYTRETNWAQWCTAARFQNLGDDYWLGVETVTSVDTLLAVKQSHAKEMYEANLQVTQAGNNG